MMSHQEPCRILFAAEVASSIQQRAKKLEINTRVEKFLLLFIVKLPFLSITLPPAAFAVAAPFFLIAPGPKSRLKMPATVPQTLEQNPACHIANARSTTQKTLHTPTQAVTHSL